MKRTPVFVAGLSLAALSGCATTAGPIEVTRFHAPAIAQSAREIIAIEPAPGSDGQGLEFATYASAVSAQLAQLGYREALTATAATSPQVAQMRIQRRVWQPERQRNPVSVGVGGSTGSYGSGIGVGIGLDLSGPPPEQIETLLAVTIKNRVNGTPLWEGRASYTVNAKSPAANSQLTAAKMAAALFKGYPGTSGETIQVK